MAVLGRSDLISFIEKYKCIYPFNPAHLDGDSYILTVREDTVLQYLEHRNVTSNEIVFTTPFQIAHLTAKSKYGRMGLSFLNAAKVHSGFVGRLALELVNLSNDRSPIVIKTGDPLMHIEFLDRSGDPSPYGGEYMFQYLSDNEVDLFLQVIGNEFNNIFPIEKLRESAQRRVQEDSKILDKEPIKPGV